VIDGALARIDLLRGRPAAAVARLNVTLAPANLIRVPARSLPRLYRYRADALGQLGRYREALQDAQEAMRLIDSSDARQKGVKAARLKERVAVENLRQQRGALESRLQMERGAARTQAARLSWQLGLAAAAGLLYIVVAYVLWQRVRQERSRRERAEGLEAQAAALSSMREGVLLVGADDHIRYANQSASRLLGRAPESVTGASLESVGIRKEHVGFENAAGCGAVPNGTTELTLQRGDGAAARLLLSCSWVTRSDESLLLCVLHDLTEVRRLERAALSLADEPSPAIALADSLPDALACLARQISVDTGIEVLSRCAPGQARLEGMQRDWFYRIAARCAALAARQRGCRQVVMDVQTIPDGLELSVTGDGDALTELDPPGQQAWDLTAYLARVIGGKARLLLQGGAGFHSIVVIPEAAP
jgi:PAS domain S-box-containing protein